MPSIKSSYLGADKIEVVFTTGYTFSMTKAEFQARLAAAPNKTKALQTIRDEIIAAVPNVNLGGFRIDVDTDGTPLEITIEGG